MDNVRKLWLHRVCLVPPQQHQHQTPQRNATRKTCNLIDNSLWVSVSKVGSNLFQPNEDPLRSVLVYLLLDVSTGPLWSPSDTMSQYKPIRQAQKSPTNAATKITKRLSGSIYHQTLTYMNPPSFPPKRASAPSFFFIKVPQSGRFN